MLKSQRKRLSDGAGPTVDQSLDPFLKRLHALDGILAELKNPPVHSTRDRPVRNEVFDPGSVKMLLFFHFMSGLFMRSAHATVPTEAELTRQLRILLELLKTKLIPEHRTVARQLVWDVAALAELQRHRRQRATCPSVSAMITDLMTSLSRCRELADFRIAELYGFVGRMVEKLSTPTCLLCNAPHKFNTWQTVRMRDRHRDAPKRPAELDATAVFFETIQYGGSARTRAEHLKQIEAASIIARELLLRRR